VGAAKREDDEAAPSLVEEWLKVQGIDPLTIDLEPLPQPANALFAFQRTPHGSDLSRAQRPHQRWNSGTVRDHEMAKPSRNPPVLSEGRYRTPDHRLNDISRR
jgi:hypothetical protein